MIYIHQNKKGHIIVESPLHSVLTVPKGRNQEGVTIFFPISFSVFSEFQKKIFFGNLWKGKIIKNCIYHDKARTTKCFSVQVKSIEQNF